jgi:hypothetical protein
MRLCDRCKNKCKIDVIEIESCINFVGEAPHKIVTNFDRITASPEALAEFIHEAESVYERCAKGDLNCDYCECQWCGLAGRKDLIDWLNEECDNA